MRPFHVTLLALLAGCASQSDAFRQQILAQPPQEVPVAQRRFTTPQEQTAWIADCKRSAQGAEEVKERYCRCTAEEGSRYMTAEDMATLFATGRPTTTGRYVIALCLARHAQAI